MSVLDLPGHCLGLIQLFYGTSVKDLCAFTQICSTFREKTRGITYGTVLRLKEALPDEHSPPREEVEGTREQLFEMWKGYVRKYTDRQETIKRGMYRMHASQNSAYRKIVLWTSYLGFLPCYFAFLATGVLRTSEVIQCSFLVHGVVTATQMWILRRYFRGFPIFTKGGSIGSVWYEQTFQTTFATPYQFVLGMDAFGLLMTATVIGFITHPSTAFPQPQE